MNYLRDRIECADDEEINQIVQALIERSNSLYPESELIILWLPRDDPQERKRLVLLACRMLEADAEP